MASPNVAAVPATAPQSNTTSYVVQLNDTLSEIAADHGITLEHLLKLNTQFDPTKVDGRLDYDRSGKWDPDFIKPGDSIVLSSPVPPATAGTGEGTAAYTAANTTTNTTTTADTGGHAADAGQSSPVNGLDPAETHKLWSETKRVIPGEYMTRHTRDATGIRFVVEIHGNGTYTTHNLTHGGPAQTGEYKEMGNQLTFVSGPLQSYVGTADVSSPAKGSMPSLDLTGDGREFGNQTNQLSLRYIRS